MTRKAVLLLSGGLDSATCLALARAEGYETYALSFRYGQRHAVELDAARRLAQVLGAKEHRLADLDLRLFGGSALTGDMAVPKCRNEAEMGQGVPVTYVPARNTIFLSYALAWAEVLGERWKVHSSDSLLPGQRIRVLGLNGLTLEVQADPESGPKEV
jgi:7-cyano-7-deazaguanine synthase